LSEPRRDLAEALAEAGDSWMAGRRLLCADTRVAIELDGALHLAEPVAYRRDRRKEQLLQENNYVVLRVAAEDVGRGRPPLAPFARAASAFAVE